MSPRGGRCRRRRGQVAVLGAMALGILVVITRGHLTFPAAMVTAEPTPFAPQVAAPNAALAGGYDVSWAQCGRALPSSPTFAVIGVTRGLPYSTNPCLRTQIQWAVRAGAPLSLYMNLSNPGPQSPNWNQGGPKSCAGADGGTACAYDYGWQAAAAALADARLRSATATRSAWWLDIETGNTWSGDPAANTADVVGAAEYLRAHLVGTATIGVYSTAAQWQQVTGGAQIPSLAAWVVGDAADAAGASGYCATKASFTGGVVALVQYAVPGFDGDYYC